MPRVGLSQKKQNCMITVRLESRVLIDHFFLYEVSHISLVSVFGSLHTTHSVGKLVELGVGVQGKEPVDYVEVFNSGGAGK